jgi:predicted metal-dependent hydrolase
MKQATQTAIERFSIRSVLLVIDERMNELLVTIKNWFPDNSPRSVLYKRLFGRIQKTQKKQETTMLLSEPDYYSNYE